MVRKIVIALFLTLQFTVIAEMASAFPPLPCYPYCIK